MMSVTLDSTVEAFGNWRNTKKVSGIREIPTELWDMVFALEEKGIRPSVIKGALSISAHQYQTQKDKRQPAADAISSAELSTEDKSPEREQPMQFVEVKAEVKSDEKFTSAEKTVKAIKSNHKHEAWLSSETVIVECLRPDGYQLKIHITNKRIQEILNAFFQADCPATQSC